MFQEETPLKNMPERTINYYNSRHQTVYHYSFKSSGARKLKLIFISFCGLRNNS